MWYPLNLSIPQDPSVRSVAKEKWAHICTKDTYVHISSMYYSAKQESTEISIHNKINNYWHIDIVKYCRAMKMNILTDSAEPRKTDTRLHTVWFHLYNCWNKDNKLMGRDWGRAQGRLWGAGKIYVLTCVIIIWMCSLCDSSSFLLKICSLFCTLLFFLNLCKSWLLSTWIEDIFVGFAFFSDDRSFINLGDFWLSVPV